MDRIRQALEPSKRITADAAIRRRRPAGKSIRRPSTRGEMRPGCRECFVDRSSRSSPGPRGNRSRDSGELGGSADRGFDARVMTNAADLRGERAQDLPGCPCRASRRIRAVASPRPPQDRTPAPRHRPGCGPRRAAARAHRRSSDALEPSRPATFGQPGAHVIRQSPRSPDPKASSRIRTATTAFCAWWLSWQGQVNSRRNRRPARSDACRLPSGASRTSSTPTPSCARISGALTFGGDAFDHLAGSLGCTSPTTTGIPGLMMPAFSRGDGRQGVAEILLVIECDRGDRATPPASARWSRRAGRRARLHRRRR